MSQTLDGPAVAEGQEAIEIRSPADGRLVRRLAATTADEVATVAQGLRAAQPAWEEAGPDARARVLRDWLAWILDHERDLLELVQAESGKSSGDASLEITVAVETINHYAKVGPRAVRERRVRPHGPMAVGKRLRRSFRPYPLVGVISPWNYPLGMPLLDVPAALMAGAAVLSKPSEITPLAWSAAVGGWAEAGGPPVLARVIGAGATGSAVVDAVDMVMFTGSVATGRAVARRAAERLVPASLELGGKDAMVVLDDAPLERAVEAAVWGGLFNSGQACISVERIYVESGIHDRFVERLVERVGALRQGSDPLGAYRSEIGAMATRRQRDLVHDHVVDAVARGAVIRTGGAPRGDGLFYPPTVLTDVDHGMRCMREETFGPLLPVMRVADEDEAIWLANDSEFGLSASLFCDDRRRVERLRHRFEAGGVNVNDALANVFQFALPFGGWKASGLGSRFGGEAGIQKFGRFQAHTAPRLALPRELYWYPYRKLRGRALARTVRLLGAPGWRRRLR